MEDCILELTQPAKGTRKISKNLNSKNMQQGKLSKKEEITPRAAGSKPGRQNEETGFVFVLQI